MFTSPKDEYNRGYSDGQRSAAGDTDIIEEVGNSIAAPFIAALNPEYSAGRDDGFSDGVGR